MDTNVLDIIDPRQLGRELQRARKLKGLTQEAAANAINVRRTTMVAIEQGTRHIKPGELIKLAEAYSYPIHDLVRQRPDIESLAVQFRGPFIRTEQDDREMEPVIHEFENLCRDYLELEQLTALPLVRKYPDEYRVVGQSVETIAEAIALEERNRLGLGDAPIPILRDVLEQDVGLRVFYITMPSKFSEIYAYTAELGGCIAINRFHPEERRRWSLAHGYFHFLTTRQRAEVESDDGYRRQPESERLADAFARYFLMPTAGLTRRFLNIQRQGKVTPNTLTDLGNYYGVSMEALVRRLEAMRLLPSGMWERVHDFKWGTLRRSLGLGSVPARDQQLPERYIYLAVEAFSSGQISEGELLRFLEVSRLDARRIVEAILPASSASDSDGSNESQAAEDDEG